MGAVCFGGGGLPPDAANYVQGKTSYAQLDGFEFRGPGSGNYELQRITTYTGSKLRKECYLPLAILVILVLLGAVCGIAMAPGVRRRLPFLGDVGGSLRLPHDCLREFDDWQRSWSDEKKEWCCQQFQRGCEISAGPDLAPPPPKLGADGRPITPPWASAATRPAVTEESVHQGCDAQCVRSGVRATCRDRILYSVKNKFPHEHNSCELAHRLVLGECATMCPSCTLRDSGCAGGR